ncbi:MAG TPA: 3-deoxy-manno-octulosonate cytidylyltransferase [Gammaproteobacteria bacterium]|jgi:3-deoxy-manno-octulosonate cytidylyltransferase (CMP-KDO synthetase)|nr:3-deoxy-manno-octulosonate cytidylyltransferase [Gammaproteobacteria bacterium]
MRFTVVIPARYAAQRLPGKPLVDLHGRPLILHVCQRAQSSGAAQVIVATDDERVRAACAAAGVDAQMTGTQHASGTDRIAEVAEQRGWADDEIVVNLQGDEPLMPPADIEQAASLLNSHTGADISTLCTPIHDLEEFLNPNVVKVAADRTGRAMYFSRAPIPWNRAGAAAGIASQRQHQGALRHIGIYGYRVGALKRLAAAPPSELEQLEKLEQLRALWLGMTIAVDVARQMPGPSVDTPEDLARISALMQGR